MMFSVSVIGGYPTKITQTYIISNVEIIYM